MEENSKDKEEACWLAPVTPAKLGCKSALESSISSLEAKTGAVIQGTRINSSDAKLEKLGCTVADASSVSSLEAKPGAIQASLEAKPGAIQGSMMDPSGTNTAKLLGNSRIGLGFPCQIDYLSCGVGARSVFAADHCNIGGAKPSQLGKSSCMPPQEPCAGADASRGRNSQSDFGREDFNFTPDSKESQKKRGRKRKSTGIDLNKKPPQKVKVKVHRPKIFDASKPKKIPKEKIPKTPKEKKMRKKAEKPEKIPKEGKGKKVRKNVRESEKTVVGLDPKTPCPHTPEPLAPTALTPTLCKDITSEVRNSATLSHHGTSVCRSLNFILEDPLQNGSDGDVNKGVVGSIDDLIDVNVAGRVDSSLVERLDANVAPKVDPSLDGRSVREGGGRIGQVFDMLIPTLETQEEEDFGSSMAMRRVLQHYLRFDALSCPQFLKKRRSKRQKKEMTSNGPSNTNSSSTCRSLLSLSPLIRKERSKSSRRSKMQNLITKVGQSLTSEVQNFSTQSHLVQAPEAPNVLPLPVPGDSHNILLPVPGDSRTILENLPQPNRINHMGIDDTGFFHHLLPTAVDAAPVTSCTHQDHVLVPFAPVTCCAHQVEQFQSLVVGEAKLHHSPPPDVHSNHKTQQFQPGMHEHQLSQYQYQDQSASPWDNIELQIPQYQHVNNWWMNMQPRLFQVPPSFQVPQYQQVNNWYQPPLLQPSYDVIRTSHDATKSIDFIGQNECLHRDDFIQDQCQSTSGPLVLHQKTSGPLVQEQTNKLVFPLKKIKKWRPRVDLDEETLQVWNMLMNIEEEEEKECGGKQKTYDEEREKEEWWAKEREIFAKRVESLIARMHHIQGNRRFSQWKGSVVDSVVGVFLTQNVSDTLSSSVYMALASRFPVTPHAPNGGSDENITFIQESVFDEDRAPSQESVFAEDIASSQVSVVSNIVIDACTQDSMGSNVRLTNDAHKIELGINQAVEERKEENSVTASEDILLSSVQDDKVKVNELDINQGVEEKEEKSSATASKDILLISAQDSPPQEISRCDCSTSQRVSYGISEEKVTLTTSFNSSNHHPGGKGKTETMKSANEETMKLLESETKSKVKKKKIIPVNWDELRQNYSTNQPKSMSTMDSVNWNAVRKAPNEEITTIIKDRGMHKTIAPRIKNFLDRMVEEHENIDLEWLRNVPPDKVKDYLLSIVGLGLKSVECVRLLSLQHHAFPVDTNVGRVTVRLGWVPLQPLPENLEIDDLMKYPMVDSIQKYLWPRLCTLNQRTLYELHYQLITFGKVFCTKKQPNCVECPLQGECRYFASASARGKFRLPGPQAKPQKKNLVKSTVTINNSCTMKEENPASPQEKSAVKSKVTVNNSYTMNEENSASLVTWPLLSFFNSLVKRANYERKSSEPIVELPPSPEPESRRQTEGDIEDFCMQSGNDICPLENEGEEAFRLTLTRLHKETNETESEILKSLDIINVEASSRKSKIISRLRIVHKAYELPDNHYLLQTFDKREVDDPCPYLLATSSSGDLTNAVQEEVVAATILIPCRTAMRGSFPLNGTYFQVNEVFVDDETGQCPIRIPKSELHQFRRRALYCGASATSILKGLEAKEIQYCFWQGFICVRAFNRRTRAPKPLPLQFRPPGGPSKNFKEEYEYEG